jgi:hypothetical protein
MKKIFLAAIICAALLGGTNAANAAPVEVGDLIQFTGSLGTLGGGAFNVDDLTDATVEDFLTFCIQYTQHIAYSTPFRVGSITDYADDAGGPDPISTETAWIMSSYSRGLLNGYSSDDVQWAIWRLEGERTGNWGNAQGVINLASAAAQGGWVNTDVKVLNLFWANGTPAQDQLVYLPQPRSSVPEPSSMLLVGGGLALAMAIRRRRGTVA